jgi:hypothetical protein
MRSAGRTNSAACAAACATAAAAACAGDAARALVREIPGHARVGFLRASSEQEGEED